MPDFNLDLNQAIKRFGLHDKVVLIAELRKSCRNIGNKRNDARRTPCRHNLPDQFRRMLRYFACGQTEKQAAKFPSLFDN